MRSVSSWLCSFCSRQIQKGTSESGYLRTEEDFFFLQNEWWRYSLWYDLQHVNIYIYNVHNHFWPLKDMLALIFSCCSKESTVNGLGCSCQIMLPYQLCAIPMTQYETAHVQVSNLKINKICNFSSLASVLWYWDVFLHATACCPDQVCEPTAQLCAVCTLAQQLNLAVDKKGIIVETLELKMADAIRPAKHGWLSV